MLSSTEITPLVLGVLILRWRRQYWLSVYSDIGACFACLLLHFFQFPELSLGLAIAYVAGVYYIN